MKRIWYHTWEGMRKQENGDKFVTIFLLGLITLSVGIAFLLNLLALTLFKALNLFQ